MCALALLGACGDDGPSLAETEGAATTGTGGDDGGATETGATSTSDSSGGADDGVDDSADDGEPDSGNGSGEAHTGNCCEGHDHAGCNEPQVESCVCETDATCCVLRWDDICADAAQQECAAGCLSDDEAGQLCEEIGAFEFGVAGATLTGGWSLTESQVGEGTIAVIDAGSSGTVTFNAGIDCATTWHVWVRWFLADIGNDEFSVTIDGEPSPAAVFAGDCLNVAGGGWTWTKLNWQQEGESGCDFVQDPWALPWSAGDHTITFGYRSAEALARIVLTNDPAYVPR